VTKAPQRASTASNADTRSVLPTDERGWYLYGISRAGGPAVDPQVDDGEPVQILASGDLAALVRQVPLAEFGAEPLQSHLSDPAWVEARVRGHNQVIAAIHQEQAILPAKFGCVYARAEDLTTALEQMHETLVARLERLEGCDEWGVHVYADLAAIQQRLFGERPAIRRLQQEVASARPGRAYFLQRKLADEVAAAAEEAANELAQAAYERLIRWAVASQLNPPARPAQDASGESEILRAAFLVRRERVDDFVIEVRSFGDGQDGLRCTYSGPWPPYSFAVLTDEEAQ
jgi:hypothetical protein